MDRHLEIALVSALIAALLGYVMRECLRDGEIRNGIFWAIKRSEIPTIYWLGIGALGIFLAAMVSISIDSLLALT